MRCSRADESGDDGDGGGECVDTDGIGACDAVELTSLETAAAVDASTQTASEDVAQSR